MLRFWSFRAYRWYLHKKYNSHLQVIDKLKKSVLAKYSYQSESSLSVNTISPYEWTMNFTFELFDLFFLDVQQMWFSLLKEEKKGGYHKSLEH